MSGKHWAGKKRWFPRYNRGTFWCKQTKIACLHYPSDRKHLQVSNCIQCADRQTELPARRKPVTTTIILTRPLYWAGMLRRPCCRGLEWVIILPSSLAALPCSLPTEYCSTIPGGSANTPTGSFQSIFETPRGPKADSSSVWRVSKRLLILLCGANVDLTLKVRLWRLSLVAYALKL